MGVAIHGDGGLAVTCHCRRDVCVMGFFVDVCDDGVPEGIACDTLDVHLFADSPHELAMLGVGQGLHAAEEEMMPAYRPRCRFFNVGSGNLRDGNIPFTELGLGIAHNGKVACGMGDIAANPNDAALQINVFPLEAHHFAGTHGMKGLNGDEAPVCHISHLGNLGDGSQHFAALKRFSLFSGVIGQMNLLALDWIEGDEAVFNRHVKHHAKHIHLFLLGFLCQVLKVVEVCLDVNRGDVLNEHVAKDGIQMLLKLLCVGLSSQRAHCWLLEHIKPVLRILFEKVFTLT